MEGPAEHIALGLEVHLPGARQVPASVAAAVPGAGRPFALQGLKAGRRGGRRLSQRCCDLEKEGRRGVSPASGESPVLD